MWNQTPRSIHGKGPETTRGRLDILSPSPNPPFPSCATVPGKVNTLSPCQKWDFILLPWQFLHLALSSVPPSLSSPPLPLLPHLEPSSSFIYVVCVVSFFFLLNLKVLYLFLLAVSLHLMRSAITSHHNWSLYNYVLHHRISPLLQWTALLLIWQTEIE